MGCSGCRSRTQKIMQRLSETTALEVARRLAEKQTVVKGGRNAKQRVGSRCVYCNTIITEKMSQVRCVWHKVAWCPVCKLEV